MTILAEFKNDLYDVICSYEKSNQLSTRRANDLQILMKLIGQAQLATTLHEQLLVQINQIKGYPLAIGRFMETSHLKLNLWKILDQPKYQPLRLLNVELAEQFNQNHKLKYELSKQQDNLPKVWEDRFEKQDKKFELRFKQMANKITGLLEENHALKLRNQKVEHLCENLSKENKKLTLNSQQQQLQLDEKDSQLEKMRQINLDQLSELEVTLSQLDKTEDYLEKVLLENQRLKQRLYANNQTQETMKGLAKITKLNKKWSANKNPKTQFDSGYVTQISP